MLKKKGEEYTGFFAKHKLWVAVTTLVGTIVGAGVLGIPYVVSKAGFLYGFIIMLFLGICFIFLNLFIGEVVLRTKKQHQLTGYAEKYLGPWGKKLMAFSFLFNIYGALTAYLIGEGETFFRIFNFGSPLLYSLLFFLVTFFIIYKGVKATGKAELILISLLFLVVGLIAVFSFKDLNFTRLTGRNFAYLFFPYGVILFAYMAAPAIPELQEQLGKDKKLMKKAIIIGTCIPIVLYIFFAFLIISLVGLENFELLSANQRMATIALSFYASPMLGMFANLLAILAMFTSYLTLGIALLEMYMYDYLVSKKTAFLLTFSIPLAVTFLKLTSFIVVMGVTGAIAGGLEGILIVLMYWKAKKFGDRKPEYTMPLLRPLGILLLTLFSFGILYQLWVNFF